MVWYISPKDTKDVSTSIRFFLAKALRRELVPNNWMPTTGRFSCWFDLPERNAIVIHLAAENFDLGKAYRKQQSRQVLRILLWHRYEALNRWEVSWQHWNTYTGKRSRRGFGVKFGEIII